MAQHRWRAVCRRVSDAIRVGFWGIGSTTGNDGIHDLRGLFPDGVTDNVCPNFVPASRQIGMISGRDPSMVRAPWPYKSISCHAQPDQKPTVDPTLDGSDNQRKVLPNETLRPPHQRCADDGWTD